MPKKPKINWREIDTQRINKAIKNFNAKVRRIENNKPDIVFYQPNVINAAKKAELINEIQSGTRKEFNKKLKEIKRYSQRGAENVKTNAYNVGITNWQLKNYQNKLRQVNYQRKKEREKILNTEATDRGENLNLKRGQMADTRDVSTRPKKFNFKNIHSQKELEKMGQALTLQSEQSHFQKQHERYLENYKKAVLNSNLPIKYQQKIINSLNKIGAEKFTTIYYQEEQATIDFVYDDSAEANYRGKLISDIWNNAGVENG